MRLPRTPSRRLDFDDLSAEVEDDDDVTVSRYAADDEFDDDFDALFPDDLTPTTVAPPRARAVPRLPMPSAALPMLAPLRTPSRLAPPAAPRDHEVQTAQASSSPDHAALYSAPRPPPASYQPRGGNSPSIAPVMLAATSIPPPPARTWPVFLGAALVGCAAVAVATVPLLLKGFALQEVTNVAYVAAASPERPRKVSQLPTRQKADSVPGDVVRIDDLPVAAAPTAEAEVIAELPVVDPSTLPRQAIVAPRAERAATKATPKRVPVPAVKTAAETAKSAPPIPNAVVERSEVAETDATLHIVAMPPVNVVVDGRPLGMTPRSVKLAAGTHTVVFASPEGRQVRQVELAGGGEKTVTAAF